MCNCNKIPVVTPTSIATADGVTTLTMPSSFVSTPGCIYDIKLSVPIPANTNGTVIKIGSATLLNRLGSNVRMTSLDAQQVLRVMYLDDPAHFNLISKRWRRVCQ